MLAKKTKSGGQRFRERQKKQIQELEEATTRATSAAEALESQNLLAKRRLELLEHLLRCRDEQISLLKMNKDVSATSPEPVSNPNVFNMYQYALKIGKDELQTIWKDFLANASQKLLSNPDSESYGEEIEASVAHIKNLFKHIVVIHPDHLYSLLAINLESGVQSVPLSNHWANVLDRLHLDNLQKGMLKEVYEMFQRTMYPVHVDRERILTSPTCSATSSPAAMSPLSPAEYFVEEVDVIEKLCQSVKREHRNRLLLYCYLFGDFLTPAQFVRLAFYSYPHFPDAFGVATTVVEESQYGATPPINTPGSVTSSGAIMMYN
uniref:Uncharacterized protein n=1 Tax=Polytomella parva TaxID=51329 RepID=A0A7S0VJ26_9CHLO|mmetsp:Transcript_34320/g.61894  ORF Transcript_34320/g.61894 Transcript_34320/m.61894 type:complete len:321 (+) Transcript_34320:88-1050(+)|eukprot:CAMPEP_0175044798 /NCGR_PEP_ID=MMETSP0052_2-20121109/4030_1 /TAXON_ID=51329 ORGANISM="Polytomella parva, Strain SAG 63-3" /NCGR_SAMPLE_ID=MMETSP0052_2 /ASSEMBLY_ACC=CAM_ASM_000194 /LENGTH=320 /DNA_ID=CAMNT_0016308183 /DNA_START=28 /DNA_END=990 /DNA_ORIENTATION=-